MIHVAQIRLQRTKDEPSVEDVLNQLLSADAIIAISSHNTETDGIVQPVLVVLYRA